MADGGKHIFWREFNLADKHKIEYDKLYIFLLTTRIKKKKKCINLAGIKLGGWQISLNLAGI